MSIFIFTKKPLVLKDSFPKDAEYLSLADISGHSPDSGSISYIDITGLADAESKKVFTQIKKTCKNSAWGVIDPKGTVKDAAALFFDGASDYLGPAFIKKTKIDAKRLKAPLQWRKTAFAHNGEADNESAKSGKKDGALLNNGIKLPSASAFPGWSNMQSGKTMPFYLLYCSLQGKTSLDSRLEEKALVQTHKRFITYLVKNFKAADGLLWMDTGRDCLFLFPPKVKSAEAAIENCLRMIISAPLAASETFGLSFPVNFVFALHYGTVSYKPPGKTGTVVSDAVNSVFHLGAKKAEPGRLAISGDLPEVSIPSSINDLFVSCGEYEGRKIWHTKKFCYTKPWL